MAKFSENLGFFGAKFGEISGLLNLENFLNFNQICGDLNFKFNEICSPFWQNLKARK